MDNETIQKEVSENIFKTIPDGDTAKKLDQKIAKFQELSSIINESRLEFGNETHIEYRNLKNYLSSIDPQLLIIYRDFLLGKISTAQEEMSAKVKEQSFENIDKAIEFFGKVKEEVNNRLGALEKEVSYYLKRELADSHNTPPETSDILNELQYYFSKYKK